MSDNTSGHTLGDYMICVVSILMAAWFISIVIGMFTGNPKSSNVPTYSRGQHATIIDGHINGIIISDRKIGTTSDMYEFLIDNSTVVVEVKVSDIKIAQ